MVGHHDLYRDTKYRGLTGSHAAGGKINASVSHFVFGIAIKLLFERILAWFFSWHCSASTPTLTLLHRVQGSRGRSWRHNTELVCPTPSLTKALFLHQEGTPIAFFLETDFSVKTLTMLPTLGMTGSQRCRGLRVQLGYLKSGVSGFYIILCS